MPLWVHRIPFLVLLTYESDSKKPLDLSSFCWPRLFGCIVDNNFHTSHTTYYQSVIKYSSKGNRLETVYLCSSLLSVTVVNTMTESTLGRGRLMRLTTYSPLSREDKAETRDRTWSRHHAGAATGMLPWPPQLLFIHRPGPPTWG